MNRSAAWAEGSPLEIVAALREELARAAVPATALATMLGTIEREGRSAVYVTPAAPDLSAIIVTREAGSGDAEYAELTLADTTELGVPELERAYGPYTVPPAVHFGDPTDLVFAAHRPPGAAFATTLIAQVEGDEDDLPAGRVRLLALRRDPR